ncbi:MAG: ClbS/DfsB family four-helix bundle protein [Caldilineaceae bacterium]
MDSISGLSEETIVATAVCGEWSIRDVLVHVLSWSEYEYAVLKQWPDTTHESLTPWLDGNGVDDINAALLAERATLNMIDVCDGLTTYHRRILRYFDKCSDEQLADSGDYGWGKKECSLAFFMDLRYMKQNMQKIFGIIGPNASLSRIP